MNMADGKAMSQSVAAERRGEASSATFWDRYFAAESLAGATERRSDSRLPYVPALDGLRAVAVLAVLVYHSSVRWLPGGFLGVEVFFVLSGYLITSLLLSEYRSTGRIDLKSFWIRRARRLLPALFLLLLATLTYAVIFLPQQVTQLRSDAVAAALYVTNWWLILDHKSYFEEMGRPSLLKHLWSLAVEEQFYLIWPPLFALGISRLRERKVILGVLAAAGLSTVLMAILFQPGVDPSRIYYGTDTRASELLIGAALAFVWQPGSSWTSSNRWVTRAADWIGSGRRAQVALEAVGTLGLLGIAVAFWRLGEYDPTLYRGGFLLVALATAALIATVVHPRSRLLARSLGCAPLRWIGLRSYGIYLWHWPVYMVTRPGLDVPLSGLPLFIVRLALTLALVEVSYRFVETPFRSGRVGRAWRALQQPRSEQPRAVRVGWLGVSGALALSTVTLGVAVVRAHPDSPPSYLSVQEVHIVSSPAPSLPIVAPTPTPGITPTSRAVVVPSPTPTPSPTAVPTLPAVATESPTEVPTPAPTVTPTPVPTQPPVPTPTASASYASAPTVTAVGDSVMLGAADELVSDIPNLDLDAKVGLQVSEAIQILQARSDAGLLRQVVILDIGNNGPMTSDQFDQVMSIIGVKRRVIFVNLRVSRTWEAPNNDILAAGVARYQNAALLDWHNATVNHPELFWDDGIHLRPVGANYYAMLISNLVQGSN